MRHLSLLLLSLFINASARALAWPPAPWQQPSLTVSWDDEHCTGYRVYVLLNTGGYWFHVDTTNTNVTIPVKGGFPWRVFVQPYNQFAGHRTYGPMSAVLVGAASLPLDSPQMLVFAGQWQIYAQGSTNLSLYSSTNLINWREVGPVSSGVSTYFSGLQTPRSFYKLAP